jgi:hypothetical protein
VTTASVSDPQGNEAVARTAVIIPFPVRPKPAGPAPADRLARALASLNEALAEQRVAIAAWRNALADLKGTTDGLRGSLQTYQTNLQTLGDGVSGVHAKARSLEAWADSVGGPGCDGGGCDGWRRGG